MENTSRQFQSISCPSVTAREENPQDQSSTLQSFSISSSGFEAIKEDVVEPTGDLKCDSCGNYVLQDFGLCLTCYEGGSSPADQKQGNCQEARKLTVQKCVQSLEHACYCRDVSCGLPICHKMKRVVQHTKACKRKATGDCSTCKILVAICCYHAKYCVETKCPVPFCPNIKYKAKSQLETKLQEVQTVMSTRGVGAGKPQAVVTPTPHQRTVRLLQVVKQIQKEDDVPFSGTTPQAPVHDPLPLRCGGSALPSSEPPPDGDTRLCNPQQGQSGAQGLVVGDVQQAQSGPNLAVYQQASKQLLEIVKRQPQLMAAFIRQRQAFQAMQQQRNANVSRDPPAQCPQHTVNREQNPQ